MWEVGVTRNDAAIRAEVGNRNVLIDLQGNRKTMRLKEISVRVRACGCGACEAQQV